MKKHVILVLEYDMGDYSDMEEDGLKISKNPKDYEESFFQSDVMIHEINIVGVKIKKVK